MIFYKRLIGDIQAKTGHLSPAEMGAYDRLLDHYYSTEKPLPDLDRCYSIVRAIKKDDQAAVRKVLNEFFSLGEDGNFFQKTADEMIAEVQPKIAAARANGAKGGRPKKTQKVTEQKPTGLFTETQQEPNSKASQSQITSVSKDTGGKPPLITDPDEIIFGYGLALLTNAGTVEKQARSFLGGLRKHHGDDALIDKLRECAKAKPLQPLEWLAAALPPGGAAAKPGKHAGFNNLDYSKGVNADGSFT